MAKSRGDFTDILVRSQILSPDQLEEEIRLAERSVARLLRREWAAVNKLAQALDRRGRLTGRQVGRLLAA